MAEEQGKVAELRKWFIGNKLKAVGGLWGASVIGSLAYNFSNPNMKTSVKVIHARLHAQALTLAALAGSAAVEYYDHQSGEKAKRDSRTSSHGQFHVKKLSMGNSDKSTITTLFVCVEDDLQFKYFAGLELTFVKKLSYFKWEIVVVPGFSDHVVYYGRGIGMQSSGRLSFLRGCFNLSEELAEKDTERMFLNRSLAR